MQSEQHRVWLRIIAIFKLVKALLLVLVTFGALSVLHKDVESALTGWTAQLGVDPHNYYFHKLIALAGRESPGELELVSAGSFFYALLFSIEGVGLWLRKRWAEYFTAILTGSFLPLEFYELAEHASLLKAGVIVVNIVIVVYLIVMIRRGARRAAGAS